MYMWFEEHGLINETHEIDVEKENSPATDQSEHRTIK